MERIRTHLTDGVLAITIDNEPKRNALSHQMASELGRVFHEAETDPQVRCVVITGAGDRSFCSGHDLAELSAGIAHSAEEASDDPFDCPRKMTKPTIAAVNGPARAGGFMLALACDIRVCDPAANFAANAVRLGLFPLGGQIGRLPALVPQAIAFEMLVTGRTLSAQEALQIGLVNRIASSQRAFDEAMELAKSIAEAPAQVVSAIREALRLFESRGEAAASDYGRKQGALLEKGPDAAEGIRAFLEKRKPRFA